MGFPRHLLPSPFFSHHLYHNVSLLFFNQNAGRRAIARSTISIKMHGLTHTLLSLCTLALQAINSHQSKSLISKMNASKDSGSPARAPCMHFIFHWKWPTFDWISSCILFDYKKINPHWFCMHFEENPHWLNLSLDIKQDPWYFCQGAPVKWTVSKSKSP